MDASEWPSTLKAIARAVGGDGTALLIQDLDTAQGRWSGELASLAKNFGFAPEYLESPATHAWTVNPRSQDAVCWSEEDVVIGKQLCPDPRLQRTESCNLTVSVR
jgi:hypothetical protein